MRGAKVGDGRRAIAIAEPVRGRSHCPAPFAEPARAIAGHESSRRMTFAGSDGMRIAIAFPTHISGEEWPPDDGTESQTDELAQNRREGACRGLQ